MLRMTPSLSGWVPESRGSIYGDEEHLQGQGREGRR